MEREIKEFLRRNNAVIIDENENVVEIGIKEEDPYLKDIIERLTGKKVKIRKINEDFLKELTENLNLKDFQSEENLASEAPIIKLVNELIEGAINLKATDIHIEPFESEFIVRYRIDGILHTINKFPKYLHSAVISRIKILSQLDIAEKRLPQDGKFSFNLNGNEFDIRVSTLPTIYGESVVLRILSKDETNIDLEILGFSSDILKMLKNFIQFSNGMILVTGPTGSGKTTTLYSLLKLLNDGTKKIITIEDPVEYKIEGITQVQVNEKIGLSFAKALRSILRQDPDVVMLGEIRDKETAEIAVRAALTGHLVLATLHTNDSASAFTRLIDMNIESFLVASAVIGVLSQRLVRKICPSCKEEYVPNYYEKQLFEVNDISPPEKLYKGVGCENCNYTGFKGRTAIGEIIKVENNIRKLINEKADNLTIKEVAKQKGMEPLIVNGLKKVKSGVTTLSEVLRVCNY